MRVPNSKRLARGIHGIVPGDLSLSLSSLSLSLSLSLSVFVYTQTVSWCLGGNNNGLIVQTDYITARRSARQIDFGFIAIFLSDTPTELMTWCLTDKIEICLMV